MTDEDALVEGLMEFVTSVKASILYLTRRVEALEESAARKDLLFRIPSLTPEEEALLAKAKAGQ